MNFLYDLRSQGALSYLDDFRRGSLLDLGNNQLGAASITGTPGWRRTTRGTGLYVPQAGGPNYVSPGNPASLQLSTGTIFAVAVRTESTTSNYQSLAQKYNAYGLWLWSGVEPKQFGCYDFGGASFVGSNWYEGPTGIPHLYAMSFQSGVANGTSFFVDGNFQGFGKITISNQLTGLQIGYGNSPGRGWGGAILLTGIVNRVLTPAEHGRLQDEWLQDPYVLDLPRRNFVFLPQQGLGDARETAQGLVLDTDFQRRSDGKIRDLGPNNYAGTISGVVVPGQNGEGSSLQASSNVSFGDVTQLNSVAAFTVEQTIEAVSGNCPASYLWIKSLDATHGICGGLLDAPAATKKIQFYVENGVASYAQSVATQFRSGTRQHVMWVYNGAGAADADKAKLYVDGEAVSLEFPTPNLPATTANMAANAFYAGFIANSFPGAFGLERVFSTPLTAAQVRQEYLQNFARKLLLRETFEDVPVSLVAGVAPPAYLGSWALDSGTWRSSETVAGQRSLEVVTAGAASLPDAVTYGTCAIEFANPGGVVTEWMPIASQRGRFNVSASQNGYAFQVDGNLALSFNRVTAGALGLLWKTANNYLTAGVVYWLVVSRRSSDGTFSAWIRGGIYTAWTLVAVVAGTNPIADATFWAGGWQTVYGGAGSRHPMFDPSDTRVGLLHYQGPMNPWELP